MDTDPDTAVMDVQKAIDAIVNLPVDSTRPVVHKFDLGARPILVLSLGATGDADVPYEELRARAESIQKDMENVNGVGQVSLLGAPKREVMINLDRTALDSYGIPLQTLVGVLKASNLNLPAGLLRQDGIVRTLRVVGEFSSVDEIGSFLVPLPRGGSVPLRELASVEFGYPDDAGSIRMDAKSAIGMQVVKASDANVVAVTKRIKKVLEAQSALLPRGMSLRIASDQTTFIEASLNETMRDLLLGIAVTALVLLPIPPRVALLAHRPRRHPHFAHRDLLHDVPPEVHAEHLVDDGPGPLHRHTRRRLDSRAREHRPPPEAGSGAE